MTVLAADLEMSKANTMVQYRVPAIKQHSNRKLMTFCSVIQVAGVVQLMKCSLLDSHETFHLDIKVEYCCVTISSTLTKICATEFAQSADMKRSLSDRKRKYGVWDHFELPASNKDGSKSVCCLHCKELFAYCDSMANLRKHLDQKHTFLKW